MGSEFYGPLFKHELIEYSVLSVDQSIVFRMNFKESSDTGVIAHLSASLDNTLSDDDFKRAMTEQQKQNVLCLIMSHAGADGFDKLQKCPVLLSNGEFDATGVTGVISALFSRIPGLMCSVKNTELGVSVCFEIGAEKSYVQIPTNRINMMSEMIRGEDDMGINHANYACRQWIVNQLVTLFWLSNTKHSDLQLPTQFKKLRSQDKAQMRQLLDEVRANKLAKAEEITASITV